MAENSTGTSNIFSYSIAKQDTKRQELHETIKLHAATKGLSMNWIIMQGLQMYAKRHKLDING